MDWIKVEDRKPPNDVPVLGAIYDGRPNVKMYFVRIVSRINHLWIDSDGEFPLDKKNELVTHWMPIPDAPQI